MASIEIDKAYTFVKERIAVLSRKVEFSNAAAAERMLNVDIDQMNMTHIWAVIRADRIKNGKLNLSTNHWKQSLIKELIPQRFVPGRRRVLQGVFSSFYISSYNLLFLNRTKAFQKDCGSLQDTIWYHKLFPDIGQDEWQCCSDSRQFDAICSTRQYRKRG
jgi:hypothetical protein